MALMSIFYCVCDCKFSFHPLTFSNWLFYFWKEFSFLSGKWVRVSPSIRPRFYFLWCQTQLVFSPRCHSTCSCWTTSKFCLYSFSGPMLLHSPIESHVFSTSSRVVWKKRMLSSTKIHAFLSLEYMNLHEKIIDTIK